MIQHSPRFDGAKARKAREVLRARLDQNAAAPPLGLYEYGKWWVIATSAEDALNALSEAFPGSLPPATSAPRRLADEESFTMMFDSIADLPDGFLPDPPGCSCDSTEVCGHEVCATNVATKWCAFFGERTVIQEYQ